MKMNGSVGTTTLGLKYHRRNVEQRQFNQNMKITNDEGVLLAVDYCATGEMHIGSGCMKKIIEINKFLLGTMAGGADDCTVHILEEGAFCFQRSFQKLNLNQVTGNGKTNWSISQKYIYYML